MADTEEYKDLTEKKLTVKIPAWLYMRLKNTKETQEPMKFFVERALKNEFTRFDTVKWMKDKLPEYMQKAIMDSEMGELLRTMANDIKPAFEMIQLSSIELNSRVMLETLMKKFNLFYQVAIDEVLPKDVVSLQLIQEMIDDGYLDQLSDSSIVVSKRKTL